MIVVEGKKLIACEQCFSETEWNTVWEVASEWDTDSHFICDSCHKDLDRLDMFKDLEDYIIEDHGVLI